MTLQHEKAPGGLPEKQSVDTQKQVELQLFREELFTRTLPYGAAQSKLPDYTLLSAADKRRETKAFVAHLAFQMRSAVDGLEKLAEWDLSAFTAEDVRLNVTKQKIEWILEQLRRLAESQSEATE